MNPTALPSTWKTGTQPPIRLQVMTAVQLSQAHSMWLSGSVGVEGQVALVSGTMHGMHNMLKGTSHK